ncbi:MAG: hypothetical protein ACO2ZZ_14595, partial [Cyclobacteriaceae bacterium]
MKRLFALFPLCLVMNFVLAQTNIPSQLIDQNTTWTLAGSPYQVTGNVIFDGADLTIEPGVMVIFESDYGLTFRTNSHLLAAGTEADSITFTSTGATHGGRFVFEDVSNSSSVEGDTVYVAGTKFNYVKFDNLGTVGGYQSNTGNSNSYNGNFRGPVTLLFEHCTFSNLVSDSWNSERSYSYDLLSHINLSIYNHCDFKDLLIGWAMIGNRSASEVKFYNSNFQNITRKEYGSILIQNPRTTIVNCSFSNVQSRGMFVGFYAGPSDYLIIKNSRFQSLNFNEYFQTANVGTVTLEDNLFYDITAPKFVGISNNETSYTINNTTFEQMSIGGFLFDEIALDVKNSNFSLNEGQQIARASQNGGNPILTQDLSENYWIMGGNEVVDSVALHALSINLYNDALRNEAHFKPVLMSMSTEAPPISPTIRDKRYCIGDIIVFESHPVEGFEYRWYADQFGGDPISGDPVVDTQTEGSFTFYASNYHTVSGNESMRTAVNFEVSTEVAAPIVSDVDYCLNETAVSLDQAVLGSSDYLIWYEAATGEATYPGGAPTPGTDMSGSTDYYVSYQASSASCESARSKITVTVYETQDSGNSNLPCPVTNVPSQVFDQNTTWTLAGSPYQVTG